MERLSKDVFVLNERSSVHVQELTGVCVCLWYALTPPLSTPLAPGNCRKFHMWRVRGFPLRSPSEGRLPRWGLTT